jgi:DNA (cytosine-5)-methyltransferase 1
VTRGVYYNENDPEMCAWLAELMKRGFIPEGEIDGRSIELVSADDIRIFRACHWFAGLGGFAYAARLAGAPDDWEWWSGSCPCQPFSGAGQRQGFADARHLWPHFFRLIRAGRPARVLGEQVADAAGWGWFVRVRADLATAAYSCRGIGLCSAAVDAPDRRGRIYWGAVANAAGEGRLSAAQRGTYSETQGERGGRDGLPERLHGADGAVADDAGERRREGWPERARQQRDAASSGGDAPRGALADAGGAGNGGREHGGPGEGRGEGERTTPDEFARSDGSGPMGDAGGARLAIGEGVRGNACEERATVKRTDDSRSFYAGAEWIECHDGKIRRAQPGIPLLDTGLPGRISMWRGLGNAVNAQLAAQVIAAFREAEGNGP